MRVAASAAKLKSPNFSVLKFRGGYGIVMIIAVSIRLPHEIVAQLTRIYSLLISETFSLEVSSTNARGGRHIQKVAEWKSMRKGRLKK